jgi:rubrerythrin
MKKTNDGQECEKCEYQWYPRKEKPRQCPFCKSMKWNGQLSTDNRLTYPTK